MTTIDGNFTFGDLATLRALHGIVLISFMLNIDDHRRIAVVQFRDGFPCVCYGDGVTEAEALNDAMTKGLAARSRPLRTVITAP